MNYDPPASTPMCWNGRQHHNSHLMCSCRGIQGFRSKASFASFCNMVSPCSPDWLTLKNLLFSKYLDYRCVLQHPMIVCVSVRVHGWGMSQALG